MQHDSSKILQQLLQAEGAAVGRDRLASEQQATAVSLGKRLAPMKTSAAAAKRAKRNSELVGLPIRGVDVVSNFEDSSVGDVARSHPEVGAHPSAMTVTDKNLDTDSDKSDGGNLSGGDDDDVDSEKRRERRLLQNRKSAKKCRLKKKAEFHVLAGEVEALKQDRKELQDKINEITLMLYSKIDENNALQQQLSQQNQQLLFHQQLASLQQANQASLSSSSPSLGCSAVNPAVNLHSLLAASQMGLSQHGSAAPNSVMPSNGNSQQSTQSTLKNLLTTLQDMLKGTNSVPSTAATRSSTEPQQQKSIAAPTALQSESTVASQLQQILARQSHTDTSSLSTKGSSGLLGRTMPLKSDKQLQSRLSLLMQQYSKPADRKGSL